MRRQHDVPVGTHGVRLRAPAASSVQPIGAQAGMLALQRSAGNAAVSSMVAGERTSSLSAVRPGPDPAQRQAVPPAVAGPPNFVLRSLGVANAMPVAGAPDTFVANAGATIDMTANVASGTGAPVTARDITWAGGLRGATTTTRRVRSPGRSAITAKVNGVTKMVALFIVGTAAPPAANVAAPRAFNKIGVSNPGANFGLTVVTIGRQGVKAPTFVVTPYFDDGNWSFRLVRIRHGFKVGVNGQGRRNITGPASVSSAQLAAVAADLTPPGASAAHGPPRTRFWNQTITTAHEQAHVDRFYSAPFWGASMTTFETKTEDLRTPFQPTTANTATNVMATLDPILKADVAAQHGIADAAEIGGSEPAAHGVSNPMYTALLAAIVAGVRPPPAATVAATPAQTSVVLTWTQVAGVTNGTLIERSIASGAFAPAVTVASGVLTFTDAGLAASTRVRYR